TRSNGQVAGLSESFNQCRRIMAGSAHGANAYFGYVGGQVLLLERLGQEGGTAPLLQERVEQLAGVRSRLVGSKNFDSTSPGRLGIERNESDDGHLAHGQRLLGVGEGNEGIPARLAAKRHQAVDSRLPQRRSRLLGTGK